MPAQITRKGRKVKTTFTGYLLQKKVISSIKKEAKRFGIPLSQVVNDAMADRYSL